MDYWWHDGDEYTWLGEVYMWWIMSLAWSYMNYTWGVGYICGHKFGMSNDEHWWLVIQWHGIGMGGCTLLMVGNNELVLIQHVINEGWLRMLVWSSYAWYMYLLLGCLYMFGKWSVRNHLESLGETSWFCFSGRNIIPWPLLVGVHGGASSI